MQIGDIILIPFPFTDLTGVKTRPVVVLGIVKDDLIVAFISGEISQLQKTDIVLFPNVENGLKKDSLLKVHKIATLHKKMALGSLGFLNQEVLKEIKIKLNSIIILP